MKRHAVVAFRYTRSLTSPLDAAKGREYKVTITNDFIQNIKFVENQSNLLVCGNQEFEYKRTNVGRTSTSIHLSHAIRSVVLFDDTHN